MESWLKPMLCNTADVVPEGHGWVLEPKLDGWRLIAHHEDSGRVRLYAGRNGSEYTGLVPYITEAVERLVPRGSVLDGELVGQTWGHVQSVMTRGGGAHIPSRALPALTYVVFDATRLAGLDIRGEPWSARRELLEHRFKYAVPEHVQLVPVGESTQAAHDALVAHGLEGTVSKRTDSVYANHRSPAWVKVKPQATAEATVVGFKPGTTGSNFDGMVGALELEMVGSGARTRASGFDMATRRDITDNPERWLGTVVEIKHHGLSADGVPRHPQFLRRRDDRATQAPVKKAKEVTRMAAPSPRNYGAMKDDKLLRVMHELQDGGDAADRCIANGFDPADDLVRVRQIAESRGLL